MKILWGDQEDEERDHSAQDEQTSGSEDLDEKINSMWERAEREIGITH